MIFIKNRLNKLTVSDSAYNGKKNKQRFHYYLTSSFIGTAVMMAFGIGLSLRGEYLIAIADFVCSIILISNFVFLRITQKLHTACVTAALTFMGFLLLHLITGGTDNAGPFWFFIFPPLAMYLLGKQLGLTLSIFLAVPTGVVWMSLLAGNEVAGYTSGFILRFLIAYLLESFLFYIMEAQRSEAQKNVKILSGLLPICSHCKKIRDSRGYWNNLESYVEKHSDALFSHSICSECTEKLYGNEPWYNEMKKENR